MTDRARLVVATYNVHGFVGGDGRYNAQRIVDVLDDVEADLIALQEVEHRTVAGTPVGEWLGEALGMHVTRLDTFRRGRHDYGNLLLSRERPVAVRSHDLSVPRREPRKAIDVDLVANGGEWRVIATHLGLSMRERRIQFDRLSAIVEQAAGSEVTVLAGDFNEWRPFTRWVQRLGAGFGAPRTPRAYPARRPAVALDRIVARPAGAIEGIRRIQTPVARDASDHLPLVATLGAGADAR